MKKIYHLFAAFALLLLCYKTNIAQTQSVTAGRHFSFFKCANNQFFVKGWENFYGQLGNGTTTPITNPEPIALSSVTNVFAGYGHTMFIKSDGTVWATGRNDFGQLGDGTMVDKSTPVQITTLTNVISIAAGITHTLFLKNNGTVWACGNNTSGELGDGTNTNRLSPVQVTGLTSITAVAANGNHSLFLKSDATVWATGRNVLGQLGDGTIVNKNTPVQITALSGITAISAGNIHSLFLKNNGTAWACGSNMSRQLGDGTTIDRVTPVQSTTLTDISTISAGGVHSLFLRSNGTAWSCGENGRNQLAQYSTAGPNNPAEIPFLNDIVALEAGDNHSSFINSMGSIWETNPYTTYKLEKILDLCEPVCTYTISLTTSGPSCNGCNNASVTTTISNATSPYTYNWSNGSTNASISGIGAGNYYLKFNDASGCIAYAGKTINQSQSISAGGDQSFFNCNNNTPKTCGGNFYGQLGDGTTTSKNTAVPVSSLTGIVDVKAGKEHTLFLKNDGTVWGTGRNNYGQLGDGTILDKYTPIQITSLTNIIAIAAGYKHSLFLKNDGTVWACGANASGQLGDGTTVNKNYPIQVSNVKNIVAIVVGDNCSFFLKNDGTAWACGSNSTGGLGFGNTDNGMYSTLYTPTELGTIRNVKKISTGGSNGSGSFHALFLKNDGSVWATGLNSNGQLGDGTITNKKLPFQIPTLSNIMDIECGHTYSLFLKSDKMVWVTGYNAYGQLGDGTTSDKYTPIQNPTLSDIVAIDAGGYHSIFLRSDGIALACGTGSGLGDGSGSTKTSPVYVTNVCSAAPACNPPTAVTYSNISSTSAVVSFTSAATNWQVEYGVSPYTFSGTATATLTTNPATLTGLTAGTTYQIKIRSVCSGIPGTWSSSSSFNTTCSLSAINALPYNQSFDATGHCWSSSLITGTTNWGLGASDGVSGPHTGANYAGKNYNNSDALFISPQFNLAAYSANTVQLSVWIFRNTQHDPTDRIRFHVNTVQNLTGATQLLEIFPKNTVAPTVATVGWYNYTVVIPASYISGGNFYVLAQGTTTAGSSAYGLGFDDFKIETIVSSNANLSALTSSQGSLSPTFSAGTTNYTVTLPFGSTGTGVLTPTQATTLSTITSNVNASNVAGTAPNNVAYVVVTAQSGATNTYTVTYNVAALPNGNSSLSSLTSSLGTLSPSFVSSITNYTITLPYGASGSATLTPVTSSGVATVTTNTSASNVNGASPSNVATVVVTAQNGSTTTYTVTYSVTPGNTNSSLNSLTTSVGTLSPSFVSSITNYTVTLPFGTTGAATLTPTLATTLSTVTLNTSASNVAGTSPANVATVVVTAQTGATTSYTVVYNVTPGNNDATLSSLTTSQGALVPAFASTTYAYSVVLPEGTTGTGVVTPTLNTSLSTVTFIQNASNVAGTAPANTATVLVTAQDGTTALYTIVYSIATGIKETSNATNFEVYPNPTNGVFVVNMQSAKIETIKLSVATLTGQVIFEKEISTNNKTISEQIDLSKQAKGIYFVKVIDGIGSQTKRIVLQ